jgi:hypothetical protein
MKNEATMAPRRPSRLSLPAVALLIACGCEGPPAAQPPTTAPVATASTPKATCRGPKGKFGHLGLVTCGRNTGWAWDSAQPESPVRVEIYDGDRLLATLTADIQRADLVDSGVGDGRHGFAYTPDASLQDGKDHSIRAKLAGTDVTLVDAPKVLNCSPQAAPGGTKSQAPRPKAP